MARNRVRSTQLDGRCTRMRLPYSTTRAENFNRRIEFTRMVLDRLAEEGDVENPIVLWQECNFGRSRYQMSGYAMLEDDERLLLFATVYTGDLPTRALAKDQLLAGCSQALHFYEPDNAP